MNKNLLYIIAILSTVLIIWCGLIIFFQLNPPVMETKVIEVSQLCFKKGSSIMKPIILEC